MIKEPARDSGTAYQLALTRTGGPSVCKLAGRVRTLDCQHLTQSSTVKFDGGVGHEKASAGVFVVDGDAAGRDCGPEGGCVPGYRTVQKAFDASDVEGVVKLFAPDAIFLGTVSPKLITTTEEITQYFQGLKQFMPRSISIETYSAMVLSENAVLFAGFDTFSQTKEGKAVETPARFTLVITKNDRGWRISHFHSSVRPKPQ